MAPSMVSEWMEDGTMHEYMKKFPRGGAYARTMVRPNYFLRPRDAFIDNVLNSFVVSL